MEQSVINSKRKNTGFSLVEVLVATSVLLVFITLFSGSIVNLKNQLLNSLNRERAVALLNESVEAVRSIRDNNFSNLIDGTYGLNVSGGNFVLSGGSDITDIFTRTITISTKSGNQKKVNANITWQDNISQNNSVSASTYMTNWRAPLSIGLTIDKTVINHGGTKTANDFLPNYLSTTTLDNTVDPPTTKNVDIPIIFSPLSMSLGPGTYTFLTSNDPNYNLTMTEPCNNGLITLSDGDAKLCTITYEEKVNGCTGTPWGDIADGTSNIAYQSSSVYYPNSCISETRTCTGGILSGSYMYTSCSVASVPPTVTTSAITSITQTSATSGGTIVSNGVDTITLSGIVWDTSLNPTTALSTKNTDGWAIGGPWSDNITGLSCATTYYVRAYAINSVGTAYGSNISFTTLACNAVPTVTTPTATSVAGTSAVLGATVTSLGIPASISARGFCYGTSPNPMTNCIDEGGTTTGTFTETKTGLTPGTLYYYRGYATNSTGTGYSSDGTFTTLGGTCVITGILPTTYDSSGSTSAVVNKPTGIVQNDIMFAYILHNNATDRLTTIPSGWTQIGRHKNGSSNQALYYKVAGASEPSTYTFGLSASSRFAVTISAYRGCFNTTTPIETSSNVEYVINNTTVQAGSLTLPSSYTTIIIFPSVNVSGVKTFTAPTTQGGGWTEDYNSGNSSSQFSRSAFSKMMISSGATGVINSIVSATASTGKHAFGVALKPIQ